MTGVLGKYEWLAGMALDFGVPALGMAFGIPGGVSSFAVSALKKALGMAQSASEEDVKAKVESLDPDTAKAAFENASTEVTAKYAYLTELAKARADVDKANIAEVNKSIRTEVAAGVSWWHWRHLLGYLVILYGVEQVSAIAYTMFGKGVPPDQLATLFNSTSFFTLGLFGLLGYVAQDTTNLKTAAMTGEKPEGVVASVVRTMTGKKK